MRKLIILTFFTCFCMIVYSQSNIRINNYWENTYFINPASIYSDYNFMLSTAAKKQWVDFPGAPTTGYFTATMFSPRWNTQIGIQAIHDKIGFTTMNNIGLSYAYSVEITKSQILNLGISGKIQDTYYDMNKSATEIIGDPAVENMIAKQSNFNADIGVEFVGKDFLLGAASQNFASLFSSEKDKLTNTNFVYAFYGQKTKAFIRMNYGICFIQNESLSQFEFNLSGYLNKTNHPDFLLIGLVYRTKHELAAIFGLDISKNVRFAYNYDFFIGDISRSSKGSHEFMLLWKFGKIPQCTTCTKLYK